MYSFQAEFRENAFNPELAGLENGTFSVASFSG